MIEPHSVLKPKPAPSTLVDRHGSIQSRKDDMHLWTRREPVTTGHTNRSERCQDEVRHRPLSVAELRSRSSIAGAYATATAAPEAPEGMTRRVQRGNHCLRSAPHDVERRTHWRRRVADETAPRGTSGSKSMRQ